MKVRGGHTTRLRGPVPHRLWEDRLHRRDGLLWWAKRLGLCTLGDCGIVAFRSAKAASFAERKVTLYRSIGHDDP